MRKQWNDVLKIEKLNNNHRDWVRSLFRERWGASEIVTRGRIYHAERLPGFVALEDNQPIGLITYNLKEKDCEIVSLDSIESGRGIGSALIKEVVDLAIHKRCHRVWLITTNDNTGALRFYQKIGFDLVAIHRDAIEKSRMLKPEIPQTGNDGIPIKHEIELEIKIQ